MKKIQYYLLFAFFTIVSCKNDSGTSKLDLETGTIPDINKSEGFDAFLDLTKISEGEIASIGFNVDISLGVAEKTDVIGIYRTKDGTSYHAVLFEDIDIPSDLSLDSNQIINSFSILNSKDDYTLGDRLSISTRFSLENGTVLNIIDENGKNNIGTNHLTTPIHTPIVHYNVSCPSDLGGTYEVTTSATGCCDVNPIENYTYTVIVTDNGGGSYSLSDYSGGAYDGLFCSAFGLCDDLSGGNISDVCGTISGSAPDCCGSEIEIQGVVNEDGSWSLEISSGFMNGTSTWVKQ